MARRARNGVVYSGPFFEADPAKRIGQNIAAMVKEVTHEAANMQRAQFTPGRASELAPTIAERAVTVNGRTYGSVVYSTMTGPNPRSPNPHSWVTWAETGRRRQKGQNVAAGSFKGFRQWARVRSAVKAHIKEEQIRLGIIKGVA